MATNRYANGRIYKLVNYSDDEIYVGSTCEPLHKRLYKHKAKAKVMPERRVYQHLLNVGWENVSIILVENFSCESKEELLRRERYWIDELKPSLNHIIPTRSIAEWRKDNQETLKAKKKAYREANIDAVREKNRKWAANRSEEQVQKHRETMDKNREIYNANRREKKANNEAYREACNARSREWRAKKKAEQST